MKRFILSLTLILTGSIITLGIIYGYKLFPKSEMGFDFNTLGTYLGAFITAFGLYIAIRQIKNQTNVQKQNISLKLFDRRMSKYNTFVSYFNNFEDYDNILGSLMDSTIKTLYKNSNMFKTKFLFETKLLFDKNLYHEIKTYIKLLVSIKDKYFEFKTILDEIYDHDYLNGDFYIETHKMDGKSISKKNEEQFFRMCALETDPVYTESNGEACYPNELSKLYKELNTAIGQAKKEYNSILLNMETIINIL